MDPNEPNNESEKSPNEANLNRDTLIPTLTKTGLSTKKKARVSFGEQRHFLEHLTAWGAVVAAIGAVLAAGFSAWQSSIANRNYLVSREALTDTQRAFVFPAGVVFSVKTISSESDFQVIWKNSGTTPTKDLFIWTNWGGFAKPLTTEFPFYDLAPNGTKPTATYSLLGPQATMLTTDALISPDVVKLINTGKIFYYVWGWSRYNDIFPLTPQHITRFCYLIKSFSEPSGTIDESTTILYAPCEYGNCADSECKAQWLG